jgi:hemerythrin
MPDTNCVFRWTETYKVNIAILDQQHQGLFDTVNELERALRLGEGNAAIDGILDRLVTYAGLHFAAEESLVELLLFLQSWLKKHVLRTDKQYSAFLNARGVH